eukprot:s46_g17.t1
MCKKTLRLLRALNCAQEPRATQEEPLSLATQEVLSSLHLAPVENHAESHCFWVASLNERLTEQQAMSLLSPTTSAEQIAVVVTILCRHYVDGLVVLHDPAQGAYLFRPSCPHVFLPFASAMTWVQLFPKCHIMLYTQSPGNACGHFQHCSSVVPDVSPCTACPSIVPCAMPSAILGHGFVPQDRAPVDAAESSDSSHGLPGLFRSELSASIADMPCQPAHSAASCFCLQQDVSQNPRMTGGSSNILHTGSIGSTFAVIRSHSGTIDLDLDEPATPLPEPATPAATYRHLLHVGVPSPLAREAARRYLHDLDAALDWACSADRGHTRSAHDNGDSVDVVDSSSSETGSGHFIGSPIALAPPSSLPVPIPGGSIPTASAVSSMSAPNSWLQSVTAFVPHAESADAQKIAAPASCNLSPMQTSSVAAADASGLASCTPETVPEIASDSMTPLPWQPSPEIAPGSITPPSPVELLDTISPTVLFHVECSAPATWLDRLNPSFSRSPSLSHASLTPEREGWQQGFASIASSVNCRVCQAFHLSECFCLQPDASEDPSMVGGSASVPPTSSTGSSFRMIRRHSGTIDLDPDEPATPLPEPATPVATYWHLLNDLNVGVPAPIAREAARRYLHDLDAALDWACSSNRRHTRPALDSIDIVDVVDSSSEAGSGPVIGSPIALAPPSSLTVPIPNDSHASVSSLAMNECTGSPIVRSIPTVSSLSAIPAPPATWLSSEDIPVRASLATAVVPHGPIAGDGMPADLSFAVPLPATSSTGAVSVAASNPAAGTPENWSPVTVDDQEDVDGIPPPQADRNSMQRMPPPCFLEDPEAEVHSWFCLLANSNGAAAWDANVWSRMPLYSEYIQSHSLAEIRSHSLKSIQKLRGVELSIEQAAKLPRCLGQTALLPIAVGCEYLHRGCGLPAIFAFDLFQACLASCQNKALEVTLYGARSKSFSCKARWWACPTGDPNAGKSPTCAFVMKAFARMIEALPQPFLPDQHWIGVGNNNRIQNRLRALQGTLLLYGPESKPILDPHFPVQKKVDTGKYLDLTRWLESANGGSFEWGTGAEELERQKRKPASKQAAVETTSAPLVFDPTNINICLFQQFSLFEDWWCQVEALHKCGFSARILMSPTGRAIVEKAVGLQDPEPIAELMQKVWRYVATVHGPQSA